MTRLVALGILATGCFFLAALPVANGEPSAAVMWKVGLARRDITPQKPIWLAGYAARNKPSEGVLAPLYATAMAIEDAEGHRALLVTADLIGFRKEVAEAAVQAVTQKTQLPREWILFNWSHTHTGPVVGLRAAPGYSLDDAQQAVVEEYTRWLIEQYAELAAEAVNDLRPAKLAWGTGVVHFPMNRREFTESGVRIGVNPRGYVDRSVPVLVATEEGDKPRTVLFGCACHNTTLTGEHYVISGDYAGFARAYIEEKLPGIRALFMTGCGADVNPYPRSEIAHAQQHGEELGKEVCRLLGTKLRPIRGPLKTAFREVQLPLAPVPSRQELLEMARGPAHLAGTAKRLLEMLDRGDAPPTHYPAPFAVWQFGEDLTLVALPGEVVSDYVPLIESTIGHVRLWIAAYCHEVFGYLPSAKVLREGGYETRGVGTLGFFSPEAETVVIQTIRELAQSVGRPQLP